MKISATATRIHLNNLGYRSPILLFPQSRIFMARFPDAQDVRKESELVTLTVSEDDISVPAETEIRRNEILVVVGADGTQKGEILIKDYEYVSGDISKYSKMKSFTIVDGDSLLLNADEVLEAGYPTKLNPSALSSVLLGAEEEPETDNLHFQSVDGKFLQFFF